MNSNFGNLSLRAAEWKPRQSSNNTDDNITTTSSDLNPGQVKEFIPGQGWTVTASNSQLEVPNTREVQGGR
jgi:hypothetical protein